MDKRKSAINQKVDLTVGVIDSINLIGIFSLFLQEVTVKFLEETGRFFMFPLAAMGSAIRAVLAWRQAALDNGKHGTVVKAAVETVGALAIGTAVVGGFVAASLFATVAPIIFTATIAAKTLYHAACSMYYWGKSVATADPLKKQVYRDTARAHAIGTVANTLSTIAIGFVMLAAKPIFAVLGLVAGLIGTGFCLYKLCTTSVPPAPPKGYKPLSNDSTPVEKDELEHDKSLSQTARLHQALHKEKPIKKLDNTSPPKKIEHTYRKLFDRHISTHEPENDLNTQCHVSKSL